MTLPSFRKHGVILLAISLVFLVSAAWGTDIRTAAQPPRAPASHKTLEKTSATLARPIWHDDLNRALTVAQKEGKPVFALFTGSDWCPWCIDLESEVLSKKEFQDYARGNLVLYKADFLHKRKLPEALMAMFERTAQRYGVSTLPTVLILDSKGKRLAATGYREGGAALYVKHLRRIVPAVKKPTPPPLGHDNATTTPVVPAKDAKPASR